MSKTCWCEAVCLTNATVKMIAHFGMGIAICDWRKSELFLRTLRMVVEAALSSWWQNRRVVDDED
jgi:hypothetical protein